MIGMVGAKVAVDAEGSLLASQAIDFVAREEFDYTCKEIAESLPFDQVLGISFRLADGTVKHNAARPMIENMDELPFVAPVYKRDLTIKNYFLGYLNHPYLSFYTGRGRRSRCTFCLWPQTVGGHNYRTRSAESVIEEVKWIKENMPEVKEIMFGHRPRPTRLRELALFRVCALACIWCWPTVSLSCRTPPSRIWSTQKVVLATGWPATACGFSFCPGSGDSWPPRSAPSSKPLRQAGCRWITSTPTSIFICIPRCWG